MSNLNVNEIRKDFPILFQKVHGKNLIYLDNAATTHKPIQVVEAIKNYYKNSNANPHRGAHFLGVAATNAYEDAREKVRKFINAASIKKK